MATNKASGRVLPDLKAANKREAELLAQIEALKAQVATGGTKETTLTIEQYQGKPVIHFQGAFRPFHMGLGKLTVIVNNLDAIKRFIASKGKAI